MRSTLVLLLLVSTAAARLCAAPAVLYVQNFDEPTGQSIQYPGVKTSQTTLADRRINGWASGGVLKLSHLEGVGVKRSGGLLITPVEGGDGTAFYYTAVTSVRLPGKTGLTLRPTDLWALKLNYAARIPVGRQLECAITLLSPRKMETETWATRLRFPPVSGTGAFAAVEVTGADLPDAVIDAFIATARKLGERRVLVNIRWFINNPNDWQPGESIALDDISFGSVR